MKLSKQQKAPAISQVVGASAGQRLPVESVDAYAGHAGCACHQPQTPIRFWAR